MRHYEQKDFETIKGWIEARGNVTIQEGNLSPVGAIIDDMACGFLQFTDNSTFSLESFATNPAANPYKRAQALIDIAVNLVGLAKENGFKRLQILTRERSIGRFLSIYGFSLENVTMAIKYI